MYVKTGHAIRDLVCSFMERQDRTNEDLLPGVIELPYWVDDPEGAVQETEQRNDFGNPAATS